MKNLSSVLAIILAGLLGTTTAVQARGYNYGGGYDRGTPQHRFENRVDRRQTNQWRRINDGIENGELSRREAKRLFRNQKRLARMERRFERDGYYSPRERRKMERALDRASHRIKRAKNNDHYRPYGHGHRRHAWHGDHHVYVYDPYAYEVSDDSYVSGSSSSTTISAQTGDFTISWSTSDQE